MERTEIIKALECCTRGRKGDDIPCPECPYNECNIVGGTSERQTSGTCKGWLMKDALALIKQQDDQMFQLENRLKECENGYSQTLGIERAKIKALTEENETLTIKCNAWHLAAERVGEEIQVIKANTVREFAERLKAEAYVPKPYGMSKVVDVGTIDRIAKEILNKTEDEKK